MQFLLCLGQRELLVERLVSAWSAFGVLVEEMDQEITLRGATTRAATEYYHNNYHDTVVILSRKS